jgi:hypothetical protein
MKRLFLGIVAFLLMLNFIGCSKSGSGGAMTFSSDNIKELNQKIADVSKSMDPNMKQIDAIKTFYKDTINDMGYSLDETETILAYIKYAENKDRTQRLGILINIFDPLEQFIVKNPKLVIDKDLVKQETVDKLKSYYKYRSLNKKTIQVIKYVKKCQEINNGNCTIEQFIAILFDNNFVKKDAQLTVKNFWDSKNNMARFQFQTNFTSAVNAFEKYVVWKDGSRINSNFMFADKDKQLKLTDNALKDLENYNPWWLK